MSILRFITVSLIALISLGLGATFFAFQYDWIDFSILEHYQPGKPSIVLDDEGKEWARFALDRREPINIDMVPRHVIQAFMAAEDHYFYQHGGISYKGIIRSSIVNLYHGKIVQGASTITQQLVKLLFTDSKRTFERKIKEQFYALLVEKQFTKNQILQTYLNHVYFGCGIYGIEAASKRFWGKHAYEVTLDEAAVLAAIMKNPGSYCPLLYPLSAQKRRNIVLRSMKQLDFITEEEYQDALLKPLSLQSNDGNQIAAHLKEAVRKIIEDEVGRDKLYTGGLIIQTTLNRSIQEKAEKGFKEQVAMLRSKINPEVDGGLITMDVKTGHIKALVGGYDFAVSKFNRALQAKRQVGSVFKPVLYAAALHAGLDFNHLCIDEPLEIEQNKSVWKPQNAMRTFEGEITLARALSHSNNIIAIKVLQEIGFNTVIDLARKFRLHCDLPPYLSLALGCIDTTLRDITGMFNVFANNGVYVEPHFILWVKDEWGTKIYRTQPERERILDPVVSGKVAKVLSNGMLRARKRNNPWIDCESIGKTGTTNDSRTCWFTGSTPELTTAICFGCDNNQSIGKDIYASGTTFQIWLNLHRLIPSIKKTFSYDPALQELIINGKTGEKLFDFSNPNALAIMV